jgi:glycosyltransferase involved in cell wall biosynthesis
MIRSERLAAVIIPVLNEAGAIGPTVRGVFAAWVGLVVVVDGGSTDGTVAEARAAGAQVVQETRRGYGQACASGAAHAAAQGATVLVFMDGDGADDPASLPHLIAPIQAGTHDFVIASRTRGQREPGSMLWHQVAAGRLIGALAGVACGVRYSDMCAFRALRPATLARLGMRDMGYGWNLEMQMRAAGLGLRVLEVPVPYRRRIAGESKVSGNLRGTLRAGARILRVLVRVGAELRGATRSRSGGAVAAAGPWRGSGRRSPPASD